MEPEQVRNIMDSMIRKLYDMELEELGRSGWQDEKLLSEVRKLLEKNKVSIQVEDKTGREGVDLAFAIAEIGEEIGFTQGGVIHLVTPSLALGLFRKNEISGNKQDNRGKIWYDKFLLNSPSLFMLGKNYGIRVRTYDYR